MARKMVNATGIFKGLRIPADHRGKYVLVSHGMVIKSSESSTELAKGTPKTKADTIVFGVPSNEYAIAAY